MSTNPPSLRYPFTLSKDTPEDIVNALRSAFDGLAIHEQAFNSLNAKVNAKAAATPTTTTVTTTSGGGGGSTSPTPGTVNDQTSETAYTLQQSDFGAIVVLNTASPFALTLNSSITTPFFCVIENYGAGIATLTPDSGSVLINTLASEPLAPGQSCLLFWNSPTEWWMTTLPTLAPIPLVGKSASLGGSPMTVGQTITAAVTITGATVGMVPSCSPETYPGDGFVFDAYISALNTVTVRLTCVLATGTPNASLYDVRVVP